MASILDLVQQHLGPQEIQQISQQLGTDPATTQQAVNAALPAMVGGLASTAQQPGGASSIQQLLGSHGGILGSLGSTDRCRRRRRRRRSSARCSGQHQADVNQGVQQASGLDSDRTRKLLMILAPIVLGALAKRAMNHGAAQTIPDKLNDVLRQDAAQAQQQAQAQGQHHVGGLLGKMLDMADALDSEMRNR